MNPISKMNCPNCSKLITDNAKFCQYCGTQLTPTDSIQPDTSSLFTLKHLVISWDHSVLLPHMLSNYRVEDQSGLLLGEAKGQLEAPMGFDYTLYDSANNNLPVLFIASERVRFLLYNYFIRDLKGNTIASLKQKSSFMGLKFSIMQPENYLEIMLLSTDSTGANQKILDIASNSILGSGARQSSLKTSKVTVDFSENLDADQRILLGAMIFACVLSTPRNIR